MLLLCSLLLQASALSSLSSCGEPPDLGVESVNAVSLLQTDLSAGRGGGSRGLLSRRPPYSLFVKFHKVAGGSFRAYVDSLSRQSRGCSQHCGIPGYPREVVGEGPVQIDKYCKNEVPHGCSHHASLEFALHCLARNQTTPVYANDLSNPANLMSDSERYAALLHFAPSRVWLPDSWSSKSRLIVVTMLRDPAEKFRSWYYWSSKGSQKRFQDTLHKQLLSINDTLANTSLEEIAQQDKSVVVTITSIIRQCCEYMHYLGGGSVDRAKVVLATNFDLVGITERFDEAVVGLGKLYGASVREIADIAKGPMVVAEKSNKGSGKKLDWTPQDYSLAKTLFAPETSIYNFAAELFDRQLGALFDTTESFDAALADFRNQSAVQDLEVGLVRGFQNGVKKLR